MKPIRVIVLIVVISIFASLVAVFGLASAKSMPLPLISALLALIGVLIAQIVNTIIARSTQINQQELEDRRARAASLQSYLEQTAKLLTDHNLRDLSPGDGTKDTRESARANDARKVAQAQTLSALEGLESDPTRKRILLQFLYKTELINKANPIVSLNGANLMDAQLSEVRMQEANLSGADLSGADLSRSHLNGADLRKTNLGGTKLEGAHLSQADMTEANLSGANLRGTDMNGTKLEGSDLSQADMTNAIVFPEQLRVCRSLLGAIGPAGSVITTGYGSSRSRVDSPYLAALRATVPLFPAVAIALTVLAYLGLPTLTEIYSIPVANTAISGEITILIGFLASIWVWTTLAYFFLPRTSADRVSPRNYNGLRERLNRLNNRVQHVCNNQGKPQRELEKSGIDSTVYDNPCDWLRDKIRTAESILESPQGMRWVTGLGYIELWHRVHRIEEALIKFESIPQALEEATRDKARLLNSALEDRSFLLDRLQSAVNTLSSRSWETQVDPSRFKTLRESALTEANKENLVSRAKAFAILSEVRYEINFFRDNVWEGVVHARNRLIDTSTLLGMVTYILLGVSIFVKAPPSLIIWLVCYFLIGALAGLFAQAQAEWGTDTAIDDFGLSTARLISSVWGSGSAAVAGVLITTVLFDRLTTTDTAGSVLTASLEGNSTLLFVAPIFGVVPNLLIRRVSQVVDLYREDLRSTQSSSNPLQTVGTRS